MLVATPAQPHARLAPCDDPIRSSFSYIGRRCDPRTALRKNVARAECSASALSVSAAMSDTVVPEQPPAEQQSPRRHVLTPRRVAAVIALVFLAVRLRRQIRLARLAIRHRRRLRLALSILVFLRQVRKGQLLGR